MGAAVVLIMFAAFACASCRAAEPATQAPPRPPAEIARGVKLTRVIDGLDKPVVLTLRPATRANASSSSRRTGRIRILEDGRLQPVAKPFLDLQGRVSTWTEQGGLPLVAFTSIEPLGSPSEDEQTPENDLPAHTIPSRERSEISVRPIIFFSGLGNERLPKRSGRSSEFPFEGTIENGGT